MTMQGGLRAALVSVLCLCACADGFAEDDGFGSVPDGGTGAPFAGSEADDGQSGSGSFGNASMLGDDGESGGGSGGGAADGGMMGPDGTSGAGGTGGADAATPDAGAPDAGAPDAGTPDAGTPDAGAPDAGTPDAGAPDAGPPACMPASCPACNGVLTPNRCCTSGGQCGCTLLGLIC